MCFKLLINLKSHEFLSYLIRSLLLSYSSLLIRILIKTYLKPKNEALIFIRAFLISDFLIEFKTVDRRDLPHLNYLLAQKHPLEG